MLKKPVSITSGPGVYIFRKEGISLYVGKAVNLKKRLASYFRKNTSQKIKQLLQEATSLGWTETSSEIEAFLKEAELIKKYRPKYNIILRDDKNYFYVGVTKEKFPRIFITHQREQTQSSKLKVQNHKAKSKTNYIGPFTSGIALKTALKLLRRVFPYCTCKSPHKRPCLNSQIGRCSGYCCVFNYFNPSMIEYQKNIKKLTGVLSGRSKNLVRSLGKEMRTAAKNQEFEKAAKLRDQLSGLENIFSHRSFLNNYGNETSITPWAKIEREIRILVNGKKSISRVEGYDISNISGKEATGSMVVFMGGLPVKSEYRKFRIKTIHQISDVDMLKEVIRRRLNHPEWSYPDLMLIDGGKTQLNAVLGELKTYNLQLKTMVAALAKREEELYIKNRNKPIKLSNLPPPTAFFLQRVRDEAHRFVRVYHHKLRDLSFVK